MVNNLELRIDMNLGINSPFGEIDISKASQMNILPSNDGMAHLK
jgi:hypothetical protein